MLNSIRIRRIVHFPFLLIIRKENRVSISYEEEKEKAPTPIEISSNSENNDAPQNNRPSSENKASTQVSATANNRSNPSVEGNFHISD